MTPSYRNIISFVWSSDFQKSIVFYRDVLGLNKVFEADGWAELSLPGTPKAFLAINSWTRGGKPPCNEFVTLGVDDLDAFKQHLVANEVRLKGDIWAFHEHGLRMLKFYDPDDNVLTLAEVQK